MALTKTKRIRFCGAFDGLMLVLSGCASTSELGSTQALKSEETARTREQVGGVTYSRARLPELNEASRLNNFLAYAALNNPQLEAAFNRWKAALEMVSQARTLPDPRFNYGYFIQEVETRVGPQEQQVGVSQMFPWFSINIPLWWGKYRAGVREAESRYTAGGGWWLWHSLSGPSKPTAVVTTQTVGPYKIKVLGEGTHLRTGDNLIRIEVTDATGKPADAGSVWLELRMDMPGIAMQAAAQLEKGQSPGVFSGSIRPTGQGEWHASIGYENRQGKNATSFTTSVGP